MYAGASNALKAGKVQKLDKAFSARIDNEVYDILKQQLEENDG